MTTRTSCPRAARALGSDPHTSARPPALANGATSALRKRILSGCTGWRSGGGAARPGARGTAVPEDYTMRTMPSETARSGRVARVLVGHAVWAGRADFGAAWIMAHRLATCSTTQRERSAVRTGTGTLAP